MDKKEITKVLRNLVYWTKENQAKCKVDSLEIHKLKMVIDHLEAALELLDIQEPWA